MKEGDILKKMLGFVSVLALFLTLSACGSDNKSNDEAKSSESSAAQTTESTANTNSKSLNKVAKELESQFNTDGNKIVKVEVQDDVMDDTSDKVHSVVEVRVIDDEKRKSLQATKDAVDANTATDDQLNEIYDIQVKVADAAKKLDADNDLAKFINPDASGNNIVIALANKTENIIPLVK